MRGLDTNNGRKANTFMRGGGVSSTRGGTSEE